MISQDTEVRINESITVIVRRFSASGVEVYRDGVLVWKAGESSRASMVQGCDTVTRIERPWHDPR